MERADVARWLAEYVAAWRAYDREEIATLFTEDARYRYHPYDEWIRGRQEIVESWFDEPDEPGTFDAAYEPAAVDGEVAVAVGSSTYTNPDGTIRAVYDNCFVMRFNDDGRCAEFTEYFIERPKE
jgi:ketosteroid isomerase-like protein